MKENIALIGMMGSGKSSTGQALSSLLEGSAFIDMDQVIEDRTGLTINQIFKDQGEPAFRHLESSLLNELSKESGIVLSTGGGIVKNENNQSLLQNSFKTIFLKVSSEWVLKRVGHRSNRPLLNGLSEIQKLKKVQELLKIREPLYQLSASHTVNTDAKTPQEVALEIKGLLS